MKSPLIIGTDVRSMTAHTLSIYSNPAVIAISQDPKGVAGHRAWRYYVNDTDEYGEGEISLWVGELSGGDYVVAFVNAGNEARMMNASLREIFFDESSTSTSGPAPQMMQSWDVYDLWANRMDNATANAIINGNATINGTVMDSANSTMKYNSTETSYANGLAMNNAALLGSKTTTIAPMGTLVAMVARHGVGFYRIRSSGSGGIRVKEEL